MKNIFKKFSDKIEKWYELSLWKWIVTCLLTALCEELLLEILGRRSLFQAIGFIFQSPFVFIYNVLIVFFTLTVALLARKRIFAYGLISTLWLASGIVNFVVLGYRITPFTAIDLMMASDVLSMLDVYFTPVQQVFLFVMIFLVIVILVFGYIKSPKVKGRIRYVANVLVCLGVFAVVYLITGIGIKVGLISDDFANLGMAYENYGFAYCFSNSVIDVGMNKPDDYSELTVDQILNEISCEEQEGIAKRPNIIMIQLESFIDIDRVDGINCDKDPVPNFNHLQEIYPSGYLTVPSIGAGTANTEFEILTGMNSNLFGAGEYPFKTVLSDTPVESMAQILGEAGYGTHAIHNNKAVFYDRNEVYANMGFDSFTSLEYMYDVNYTSAGWAKDDVLVDDILKCMNSTEGQDFIFTVSVQGHGRYPEDALNCEEHVKVTRDDHDPVLENQFGYYVNQTYEMDEMIANLIDALDATGEKYVLVLYGDHIPSLTFSEGQISQGTDFQTEYVMVNNIGLMQKDQDIYSYEMSDYILSALNQEKGFMQKIHSHYYDPNNREAYDRAVDLAQYDMLYGDGYMFRDREPYAASNMQMGIWPITIEGVSCENGELIVKGQNFNPFSVVIMNDDRLKTEYVDINTLRVLEEDWKDEPKTGDEFRVEQIDSEKHTLTTTDSIFYSP